MFQSKEVKVLYSQYFFKQKMEMVVLLLVVLAINALLLLILYFANDKNWPQLRNLVISVFVICIIIFIVELMNSGSYTTKHLTLVSLCIWFLQVSMLFVIVALTSAEHRTPSDHIALVVFITFVTYTMLPLSLIYTFILGVLLALAHALIITLLPHKNVEDLDKQVSQ